MVRRHELTDAAWAQIAPLLPAQTGQRGGRWRDHRSVINAILWKLKTGVPWRDLPERYQPWQTCYDRYVRWQRDGTWERLLAHAQTKPGPRATPAGLGSPGHREAGDVAAAQALGRVRVGSRHGVGGRA